MLLSLHVLSHVNKPSTKHDLSLQITLIIQYHAKVLNLSLVFENVEQVFRVMVNITKNDTLESLTVCLS